MNKTRVCIRCGEEYPETKEFFSPKKKKVDGTITLSSECKRCNAERARQYYQQHREECLKRATEYRNSHKELISENYKRYYQKNIDAMKERSLTYHWEHHEEVTKKMRDGYYANREKRKEYRTKNKVQYRIYAQNRRARQLEAEVGFDAFDWERAKAAFQHRCAYCGQSETELQQGHFIPVARGGGYTKSNIIPACKSCNISKNDSVFHEWYIKKPFYSEEREENIKKYINRVVEE